MPIYLQLFFRNDDIQEFNTKCDEILLSMTQIESDDILENLCKLRIRESEKLKTVLELYNMEIHQKKAEPDNHRLKTMEKRSIEQNLRMKNFEARNGDCWQWKANGQCSKGDNCSFRHDKDERAKSTEPNPSPRFSTQPNVKNASRTKSPRRRSLSGKMARLSCKITSKELAQLHSLKDGIFLSAFSISQKNGCKFGDKCSYAHRQVDEQPCKKSKKNGDKIAVAILKNTRQLGCVFQDMEPPKSSSILRKSSNILKPIRCVQFSKPCYVTPTFETKIPRSVTFFQVNLMSVAPMLQNLRIGLRKRQSRKSDGPAKLRGSWPKVF